MLLGLVLHKVLQIQRAKRAALPVAQPDPVSPARPVRHQTPDAIIQQAAPRPHRPENPRLAEPPTVTESMRHFLSSNRTITVGHWAFNVVLRLFFVAFTIVILELAATTATHGYLYFAAAPTILALLVPYGKPRKRHNPENVAGVLTICVAVLAVAIWPYYFYATATAASAPAAITATETFTLSQGGTTPGCLDLVDSDKRNWFTGNALLSSVKNNRIVLYDTAFGWTPDSDPTQSPTPFFDTPHLDQAGYTLTLNDTWYCANYHHSMR
ncbi:MAG TPA: hypothetical protein VHZ97_10350 [Pseudonocardiaceae bacterium]|nr:hypothetical protein [Pseudonocardiaceae bacterium]